MEFAGRISKNLLWTKLTRRNSLRLLWLVGFLLPFGLALWLVLGWPAAIVVSHDTTRLTGPMTEDGRYVDYVEATRNSLPNIIAKSLETDAWGQFYVKGSASNQLPAYIDAGAFFSQQNKSQEFRARVHEVLESPQLFSRQSHPDLADHLESNQLWYDRFNTVDSDFPFVDLVTPAPGNRPTLGGVNIPITGCHWGIADRLRQRARFQFGSGHANAGLATVRRMLQIAERESLVPFWHDLQKSWRIKAKAKETLWHGILHQATSDIDFLRDAASLPIDSERHVAAAERLDTIERYTILDALQEAHRTSEWDWKGPFTGPFATLYSRMLRNRTDWNAAMRFTNNSIDTMVAAFRLPSHTARVTAIELVRLVQLRSLNADDVKHSAANSLYGVLFVDPTPFVSRECLSMVEWSSFGGGYSVIRMSEKIAESTNLCRATHIAARLAAWRLKTGGFPERLEELLNIEGFSAPPENVLQDAFSGTPFRFTRTSNGFVMSSVGPNGVDDVDLNDASGSSKDDQVWHWPPENLPPLISDANQGNPP